MICRYFGHKRRPLSLQVMNPLQMIIKFINGTSYYISTSESDDNNLYVILVRFLALWNFSPAEMEILHSCFFQ